VSIKKNRDRKEYGQKEHEFWIHEKDLKVRKNNYKLLQVGKSKTI
jgi:hypothetical protein